MVKIVTLAFNRPDFIELQLNTLKKWVKDFEYVVYDNCPDDSIKDECTRLGIECIPIKIFSADTSWAVGLSLNKMWKTLQNEEGKLWYIDSDMFLFAPLPDLDCDMAFVPQERGEYTYPWTGLMYFNMETLPQPKELKWQVDYSVKDTDVGGLNHFYLETYNPKVIYLEMWTLIDEDKFSYNGKDCGYDKSFETLKAIAHSYNFPRPYSFDILCTASTSFVYHYKSASNYPEFYTEDYNFKKTKALCELLNCSVE